MADLSKVPVEQLRIGEQRDAKTLTVEGAPGLAAPVDRHDEVIPLLEETMTVSKRRKVTGTVRVTTHTDTTEVIAEVELERQRVEVTRVPVGRIVDEAPLERSEGDTTIIPVIEERFVVVKQLFLVEELHIRHVREQEVASEPVTLRRRRAIVERFDAGSKPVD